MLIQYNKDIIFKAKKLENRKTAIRKNKYFFMIIAI